MVSKTASEDDLRALFAPYGAVEEVTILRNADGLSRGCAFVKFKTRAEAQAAISALNNSQTMEGCRAPVVVKFADTEKDKAARRFQAAHSQMPFPHMGFAPAPYPYFPQVCGRPQKKKKKKKKKKERREGDAENRRRKKGKKKD